MAKIRKTPSGVQGNSDSRSPSLPAQGKMNGRDVTYQTPSQSTLVTRYRNTSTSSTDSGYSSDSSRSGSLKGRTKPISDERKQQMKDTAKAAAISLAVIAVVGLLIAGGVMVHQGIGMGVAFLTMGGAGALAGGAFAKDAIGPLLSPSPSRIGQSQGGRKGYLGNWNDDYE